MKKKFLILNKREIFIETAKVRAFSHGYGTNFVQINKPLGEVMIITVSKWGGSIVLTQYNWVNTIYRYLQRVERQLKLTKFGWLRHLTGLAGSSYPRRGSRWPLVTFADYSYSLDLSHPAVS